MSTKRSRRSKRRAVNQKFLLVCLGIVVLGAVGVYFMHKLQVDRNADVFRLRAEAAREKGESGKAIENYNRYLDLSIRVVRTKTEKIGRAHV